MMSEYWWTIDKSRKLFLSKFSGDKIITYSFGKVDIKKFEVEQIALAKILRTGEGFYKISVGENELILSGTGNIWKIDLKVKVNGREYEDTFSGLSAKSVEKLCVTGNILD